MAEQWRPVPGWEGHYEVSNRGQVRSVDRTVRTATGALQTRRGRVLTPFVRKHGYPVVGLYGPNKRRTQTDVHLLVLAAFAGLRPDGSVARHLNGDPSDNTIENLAWGTYTENNDDQVRHGTHYEASRTRCDRGHLLEGENLAVRTKKNGRKRRACKTCDRDNSRAYRARKQRKSTGRAA
ncbi:NUMOD4 motif-containing HNH endonuclease [Mycolicibacterium goodii]|uniref:NUMOD4 motif-containing HNH endonuclease n=1 Tax=Mycolicibacterium goodii TaxID=134601 RepID=A0ABS6HPE7_MYCGD|nr:NUMOD4 motif-containing HNH endonuclease [Mycolicibacterium goodii]YP_009013619.1 HNH endonuclease [Mycobacterium phage Dori]AER47718.1 HNH domain protein [Mycobacterium phage Dori]MBU8824156.1 NUMOD4 motif-containing HNH endonuclease [Mycolicibacterium goodii]MBU8838060.1 NUMOD4 motif-containing HNH endonuclease [Mycolicibacterium goodii]